MNFDLNYYTLGKLISTLEEHADCTLRVGFCNPHSYRGYYDQLAFEPTPNEQLVEEALEVVRPCLGWTFEGYKGGGFTMDDHTECWFAWYGQSGGQQIGDLLMRLLILDA